ncbi:MAG: hypothetical protein EHM55_00990 [Acidobacteria bacterium]|nr:MAG: hypothetical protein EHM55_00990 [Acidobacteriota bacterium]
MARFTSAILVVCLLVPNVALHARQGTATGRTPEYWYAYASKLPIGAMVRVRTADGKRQTAVLALVEQDGITLEPRTRIPEPPRRIAYAQIQQLELKQNGTSIAKAAAVGAGIGAGFFLVLLAVLASSWD